MATRLKVLLTGGRGLVGRAIADHPLAKSLALHAPTRAELDLRDKPQVHAYLSDLRPDVIVHAAGRVGGISANIADPYGFLLENLEVGTNVISCAAEQGIERLLNLASSCVYPKDCDGLLREEMILHGPLEPTNEGYALAKIAALRLCQFSAIRNPGLRYKTFIPCNLFGPHDKFELAYAHLVPAIIHKIHRATTEGAGTVQIWGDGTARREFMYVGDLAEAVLRAVHDFDAVPDLMNIGIGRDHTVLEYYGAAAEAIGWTGEFVFDLDKPAGMRRKVVDVERQTGWGFEPRTSLADGIRATYDFFLRHYAS